MFSRPHYMDAFMPLPLHHMHDALVFRQQCHYRHIVRFSYSTISLWIFMGQFIVHQSITCTTFNALALAQHFFQPFSILGYQQLFINRLRVVSISVDEPYLHHRNHQEVLAITFRCPAHWPNHRESRTNSALPSIGGRFIILQSSARNIAHCLQFKTSNQFWAHGVWAKAYQESEYLNSNPVQANARYCRSQIFSPVELTEI